MNALKRPSHKKSIFFQHFRPKKNHKLFYWKFGLMFEFRKHYGKIFYNAWVHGEQLFALQLCGFGWRSQRLRSTLNRRWQNDDHACRSYVNCGARHFFSRNDSRRKSGYHFLYRCELGRRPNEPGCSRSLRACSELPRFNSSRRMGFVRARIESCDWHLHSGRRSIQKIAKTYSCTLGRCSSKRRALLSAWVYV